MLYLDYNRLLREFTNAALSGSAATVATRHDCTPEKMARAALAVAVAAIAEFEPALKPKPTTNLIKGDDDDQPEE